MRSKSGPRATNIVSRSGEKSAAAAGANSFAANADLQDSRVKDNKAQD